MKHSVWILCEGNEMLVNLDQVRALHVRRGDMQASIMADGLCLTVLRGEQETINIFGVLCRAIANPEIYGQQIGMDMLVAEAK